MNRVQQYRLAKQKHDIEPIKVIFFAICLFLLLSSTSSQAGPPVTAPYIVAGDLVSGAYKAYAAELSQFYVTLKLKLEKTAPELVKKLSPEPPAITQPGYQILPKIVENLPPPAEDDKFTVSKFSWVLTGDWLESDRNKLRACEARLANASVAELSEIVSNYGQLDKNQKIINSQIEYNRLWQNEIALHRADYDANTKIYNDLVDKKLAPDQAVQMRLSNLMAPPDPFLKLIKISPEHFVIQVDAISDVEDDIFLASFQKAIYKYWHIKGPIEYEVKLNLRKISPLLLYKNGSPPARGDKINLKLHVPRFPTGYAIVTSGSNVTHYAKTADRPYVVFGAGETTASVIAHEFGHLLQLNDAYFRGYRDIGSSGFEVLEVVPDMTDLMAAPGVGRVKAEHFEILVKALLARSPEGGTNGVRHKD
jgi:hypothetical protein